MITEEFAIWLRKEEKRVDHEWANWDGTEQHGIQINDAQCARILAARERMEHKGIAEKRPEQWRN